MAWNDITVSDEYKQLSPRGRARLKQRFFEESILPDLATVSPEGQEKAFNRFMETPDDTGEGLIRSALGSAARGFFDPLAAAPEVAGAYLGIEGLEEFGGDVRGAIEGAFPVNPAEQGLVTDVAGVVGQVGQIVATGGGGAVAGAKLLGRGATEAAKRQAMRFGATAAQQTAMGSSAVAGGLERAEQLGLEGGDRLLRGAIAGGTELLAERVGGFATELGGVGKALGFGSDTIESGFMKPILRGMVTEIPEEMGVETAGQLTDIAMAPETAPAFDFGQTAYAGLLGAAGGAAFGGIEAVITPRTKKAFDGTTDFIPSSTPPPGMTAEEAEEQDLLKYGNAGEIIGYVLPVSDETIEGDLPLTVDTNVEPLVENVAAAPEASATASALRRIAAEGAGAPAATQEIPDEIVTDEATALRDAGLRMLTGQPAPVTAKAEETVDTIADEWLASQPKGMQEVIESNVQRLIQSGLNRLGGFVGKDGELDTGRIEAYRKELRKLGFDLDIDNPIGDMAMWKKTGVKNFPVISLQQAQPAPIPAQAETVTPAPVAGQIITEQEDEQITQETLQQQQSRGQELQEPRELPILPAEQAAQAPEAASGRGGAAGASVEGIGAIPDATAAADQLGLQDQLQEAGGAVRRSIPEDFSEYESQQVEKANREAAVKALETNSQTAAITVDGNGVTLQMGDRQRHPTQNTSLTATVTDDQLTADERKEAKRLSQEDSLAETQEERGDNRKKQRALVRRVFERIFTEKESPSRGAAAVDTQAALDTQGDGIVRDEGIVGADVELEQQKATLPVDGEGAMLQGGDVRQEETQQVSAAADVPTESLEGQLPQVSLEQSNAVPTESLPAGQLTSGDVGKQSAVKPVTPEQVQGRIQELLRAPTKSTKKPAVVFKTQTEENAFARGFESATQKQGEPLPPRMNNRSAKDQRWDEAWAKGWSSGQAFVRSLPDATPPPQAQPQPATPATQETKPQAAAPPTQPATEESTAAQPAAGETGDAGVATPLARSKPRETIAFKKPIRTPLGDVVAYSWSSQLIEDVDKDGEPVFRRISNWEEAATNAETGRDIVHRFTIRKKDGSVSEVSLESTMGALSGDMKKTMKSVISAAKRLPFMRAEIAELEAKKAAADADYAKVSKMQPSRDKLTLSEPDTKWMIESGKKKVELDGVFSGYLSSDEITPDGKPKNLGAVWNDALWKWQGAQRTVIMSASESERMDSLRRRIKKAETLLKNQSVEVAPLETSQPEEAGPPARNIETPVVTTAPLASFQTPEQVEAKARKNIESLDGELREKALNNLGEGTPKLPGFLRLQRTLDDLDARAPSLTQKEWDNNIYFNAPVEMMRWGYSENRPLTRQEAEILNDLRDDFLSKREYAPVTGKKIKESDWPVVSAGDFPTVMQYENLTGQYNQGRDVRPDFALWNRKRSEQFSKLRAAPSDVSPSDTGATDTAFSRLQSYISTLSPKAQAAWTPERLNAAESYYATGNESALEPLTATQRKVVKREGASESDAAAYEAKQKRQFALRNPPAATDSQFLEDYNAYVNSLSDGTLQQERESREEAPDETPRYKKILRSADGSIRRTGVKSTPARAARNSYIGVIPGVENTWLGTVEEFDAEFPDGYEFGGTVTRPPDDSEALTAADGRSFIFLDRVAVLDGDAERAEQHGTSPGVEAIKRLLRHESFIHRGYMALPGPLKNRFADFVASGIIPPEDLDYLVNNGYPHYKGWRDSKSTEMLAAEEWLAQRVERMGRIPQSGPIASIMDWLRDVWRWLTGGETTDLDKLRNTMRAMHKALGALDPKQRIVMELPDMDVLQRSVAQTQQDQEYLAAASKGDSGSDNLIQLLRDASESERKAVVDAWVQRNPKAAAEMQRMVDEAARAAGYNVGPVWRADISKTDVYELDKLADSTGFFFFPNKEDAENWAESLVWRGKSKAPSLTQAFLKMDNPRDGARIAGASNSEARARMIAEGYDSATHLGGRELVVFNSNQIKSADPVTYDPNGAPIPLSQRFQSTSSDIRYSKVQRPDPILTQPSRLRGNVPQTIKPNAQRRSVSEIFEGLDGAVEVIPRQYFPMGSKEKGNEFSATDALLAWSKDLLKPYAEDIGGLIEFLAILRSDERLQNELKLGPRSGAVVMPFLAQEAANRANALGSTDMRNAFLMEYDALGTAGGQNLWAFNIISRLPEFSSNTYSSTLDKTEEQNFAATVDKKTNGEKTVKDVIGNLPEAGEVAADNVSDGLAEEKQISDKVLELGASVQGNPKLSERIRQVISDVLKRGFLLRAMEKLKGEARKSIIPESNIYDGLTLEEMEVELARLDKGIADSIDFIEKEVAKKPSGKPTKGPKTPIETAKEIINKITTAAAKVPAKKKQPDVVRSLYRKHLKKPMSEAEFSAEAKAAGLDAATTKGLYDAINLEVVAIEIQAQAKAAERAQTKELKKAEREAEKYQNQAEAKINEVADALADPSLTQDKEKVVNPLTEIYQNQIKTPITEPQFVEQVVALGVDEETATLLFSIAAMDRQARIDIRVAREDLRRREMSEAQASKLIYAQEEELRQGSKDREPSKSGDSINKAFREQVVNPLSQEKFRERLDKLKVSQKLADRLYATAERVATDNERAEVYRKRVALLDVDSAALTRFVNDLRLKGKLTGEPIQWRDLLSLPVAHQDTVKAELLARVRKHEALRNLSTGEQQAIADALNTIWQRERRKVFQAMIKKADLMGVSKEDQEVIVEAMPALLKYINQGMLGTSAFYRAVGEKFGIAPISAEARKQVEEMAAKMQEKELYSFERAVLAEKILKILQNNTQLSRAEILSSFWVTSVLSGGRTIFDMALGVLNGGFSIAKKMITATIETRSPKAAIEGLTAFGQGIWMGAQVAAKNLIRPEEGLLASRNPAVADYFDDGARGAGLTTGDKLLLHKGDKPKDKLRRGLGVWMSFFERLFSGLDHINSTATMMGTMRMAAAMNPKLYNAALTPTKQDYANALERAKLRLPGGSNAAQIRLAQSIIEDGQHILERGLDESFMSQWRQLVADSRAEGNTASYQEEPTGAGGLLYNMVRNTTSGLEDKTRGYRDEARVALVEARKTGRGVATSAVNYFVASLGYLLGTQAQNLLGVRFMRFTGNKLNELISFIPVLGMARLQEKGMVSGEEYTLRGQNVRANQVLGWMSAFIYFSLLKGLDEEDDEERGWIVNGSWENLTPERKSQLMSDGFKPNTVAFFDKDTGRWTSYNFVSWPFAGWMAAFGSVSDYKRLTPDKWNEKILIDKTMAAAYAGAFAITDISSLSSLTEMFGRSTYTTDPAEGFQKRVVKGAANYLGGLFPKTLKDIDAWFDETNYKPEETWEHFVKEVPFYRRNVGAPLRDIFYEPVQVSRTPWSRALQVSPDDPAYKALGRLNSRGIWLTPANPENRKVKRGGKLRDMTDEESNAYMAEVGKRYKEFVMKQGDRLLEMDVDRADELVNKYTARIREIAFKRAIATAGKAAIPSPE